MEERNVKKHNPTANCPHRIYRTGAITKNVNNKCKNDNTTESRKMRRGFRLGTDTSRENNTLC